MMLVHADAVEPQRACVFEQVEVVVIDLVALLRDRTNLESMSTQTERFFSRKSSGKYGHGIRLNQVNRMHPPRRCVRQTCMYGTLGMQARLGPSDEQAFACSVILAETTGRAIYRTCYRARQSTLARRADKQLAPIRKRDVAAIDFVGLVLGLIAVHHDLGARRQ